MDATEKAAAPPNSLLGRSYKHLSCEVVDVLSVLGDFLELVTELQENQSQHFINRASF